jgi:GNAT superfamily N-acetyltransferase
MPVTIREVVSKADLKEFIRFPHRLYKDCPQWVPPLDFDEKNTLDRNINPAFESCRAKYWLAYKNNRVAGRIAGIINDKYIEVWKNKYARFGWVDFIDDEEVSRSLFDTVENWARENGMTGVQGPLGFTDFDKEGMLVEGFDEPGTMIEIYNYAYYPQHLAQLSYQKEVDWLEFQVNIPSKVGEKIERLAAIVEKRYHLTLLPLRKAKDIMPYAKEIFHLINDCYKDLFGFVPLSEKQVDYYVKQYFSFIRPDFVPVVLDEKGRIVGFGFTVPSLASALRKAQGKLFPFGIFHLLRAMKKNDRADLLLIGIRKDFQGKGVNSLIMREGHRAYAKNKITIVDASKQLETNDKVLALWEHYETRQNKRRRCYLKLLK